MHSEGMSCDIVEYRFFLLLWEQCLSLSSFLGYFQSSWLKGSGEAPPDALVGWRVGQRASEDWFQFQVAGGEEGGRRTKSSVWTVERKERDSLTDLLLVRLFTGILSNGRGKCKSWTFHLKTANTYISFQYSLCLQQYINFSPYWNKSYIK